MEYPAARRDDIVDVLHGREIPDPYRWLEDPDDPETVAWSAAQESLLVAARAGWTGRAGYRARLERLAAVGMVSVPTWAGGREYVLRRKPGQEHAVLYVDGHVVVDPNAVDPTGATTLDAWYPSKEGNRLAYAMSVGGTEEPALTVIDVDSGEVLDGPIGRMRDPSLAWLPGGESFYYTRFLESSPDERPWLHRRVYRHVLGTDPAQDKLVMGEQAPTGRYFHSQVSHDGRWLTVRSRQGTDPRVDIFTADLHADENAFVPIQQDVDALTYTFFRGDRMYVLTFKDADRGRICVADVTDLHDWRDLVVAEEDSVIEDLAVLDGLPRPVLVVATMRHSISYLSIHDLETGARLSEVALPGIGTVTDLVVDPDRRTEAWFRYTDYSSVPRIYRLDGEGAVSEHSRPSDVTVRVNTRQVAYTSRDGTPIRMFLVSKDDEGTDGPRPTILFGYGGFNNALRPNYSEEILGWVESGGVWAVASLRGGSELGESWHRAGMLGHKQNVFDDYLAATDWLVDNNITTRDRLALVGQSNGGLLVGAALTQRPDACRAVVCTAPLLDMVRYELFGLGMTWSGEYGTVADPEELDWLLSYSPYHHVKDGVAYPTVLFPVYNGDTRVDPLHGRKMAAALQHASTGGPILLRADSLVGHGARAVSKALDLWADRLSFVAASLNHHPK
jgi:prolyl oligopeptidase